MYRASVIWEIKGLPDPKNFNPSIVEWNGKTICAYRAENAGTGEISKILVVELDSDFQPVGAPTKVNFPKPAPQTDLFEDPRLFVHEGRLWMSFIAAAYLGGAHFAAQGVTLLDADFQPERVFYPSLGANRNHVSAGNNLRTREKNWMFFSHQERIWVIYSLNPLRMGKMNPNTGEVKLVPPTKVRSGWNHGEIHGSCVGWAMDGIVEGAFHGFTVGTDQQRHYHVGFFSLDLKKGHLEALSDRPFLSAKRDDAKDLRPLNQVYRPNVVFPCGLLWRGERDLNHAYMSYGWQDCRAMVQRISLGDFSEYLWPVGPVQHREHKLRDPWAGIPGGYWVEIEGRKFSSNCWQNLVKITRKAGLSDRQVELALLDRLPDIYKEEVWQTPLK